MVPYWQTPVPSKRRSICCCFFPYTTSIFLFSPQKSGKSVLYFSPLCIAEEPPFFSQQLLLSFAWSCFSIFSDQLLNLTFKFRGRNQQIWSATHKTSQLHTSVKTLSQSWIPVLQCSVLQVNSLSFAWTHRNSLAIHHSALFLLLNRQVLVKLTFARV